MDNLTAKKKLQLFNDCSKAQESVGLVHLDVKKMYAYLAKQAVIAETSNDIKSLEIAKITLDFLARGIECL